LRYLRDKIEAKHSNIELLQLLGEKDERPHDAVASRQRTTYGDMMRPSGLREIANYADAIGASIKNVDFGGGAQEARSALVDDAHVEGLKVVVYTFRPENHFLGSEFRDGGGAAERNESGSVHEMRRYIAAGIDAIFTDDPALGRKAVTQASRSRDVRPPGE